MKKFTEAEFRKALADDILNGTADEQTDNHGQVIVYACMFRWNDGTIRDEADPTWED